MGPVLLAPGDEARAERFLRAHPDTSLILRSNLRAAGLRYEGQRLQGTWVGWEEQAELRGVVCHTWNGHLVCQAPAHAAELAQFARAQSNRKVEGLLGPWAQLESARRALKLEEPPPSFACRDVLFGLQLSELIIPTGGWECRRVGAEELEVVAQHRMDFVIEELGAKPTEATRISARKTVEGIAAEGNYFVLRVEGRVVCSACFNARIPDCVQLGGVFTPRADRNRGYARRVVAGMLAVARDEGVTRAVLFTGPQSVFAQRAYQAIGFQQIGEYGLVLWSSP